MIVLITASTLPRWEGDAIPTFVLDQAIALGRRYSDLEIYVLAPHHEGAEIDETIAGVRIHRFRYFWPASWQRLVYPAILPNIRRNKWLVFQVPFLLVCEFSAMLSFCIRIRPDVIYSHWFMPQAVVGGMVASILNIPHVFTSHSSDVQVMSKLPGAGPRVVRFFAGRMHACTVVSRRTYEKLHAFFPSDTQWAAIAAKTRILPMGVETAIFSPSEVGEQSDARSEFKDRLGIAGKSVILFLGRLSEKKGVVYLLDAFASLVSTRDDLVLLVAGDGEEYELLRSHADRIGIADSVNMLGYVTGEFKQDCLRSADLLVLPSIITTDNDSEGLPVALLEGLAAGKICIATDISGADDILTDGDDGFIVPQKDAHELATAISRGLDLDSVTRLEMMERARHRAAEFDWDIIAKLHYDHLLSALSSRL